MERMSNIKVYVGVIASFTSDGRLLPLQLTWEDGRKYTIDRVLDICPAPALKAGGQGDRYTVIVRGKESYLFFERNGSISGNNLGRWFLERKFI